MSAQPLEKFGEILITRVRDKAISDWDRIISGKMKGDTARQVAAELQGVSPEVTEVLSKMIPRIVDTTLHHLLWTLEQQPNVRVSVELEGESVRSVREASDGLSGELYGRRGWIARFSGERHEQT
jgi:hypothetical protein